MMRRILTALLATLTICTATTDASAAWTAFNDCAWRTGQLSANITTNAPIGSAGVTFSPVNYANGATISGVSIGITGPMNGYDFHVVAEPTAGSDGYTVFGDKVSLTTAYSEVPANTNITVTISGLDATRTYSFAMYASRGGISTDYSNRWTDVTLTGIDGFANGSSASATRFTTFTTDDSARLTGANMDWSLIRFDSIQPGSDGIIQLIVKSNGTAGQSRAYLNAFMLQEFDAVETPSAPTLTAPTGSALSPTTASVSANLISTGALPTQVWLYWGDTDAGTTKEAWSQSAALGYRTTGVVSTNLAGLMTNHMYYFRFYASNSVGAAWAAASFTTPASTPTSANMWRRGQVVGIMGLTDCALYLYAQNSTGPVFIDDVSVVAGVIPESGVNRVVNPGFENGTNTWLVVGDHIASAAVTSPKRSGSSALRLQASVAGLGGSGNSVKQTITGLVTGQAYTVSYWYLATNAVDFIVRFSSHPYLSSSVSVGPGGTTSNHPAIPATKIMPIGDSITQLNSEQASYRYWLWKQLTVTNNYSVDFLGAQTNAAGNVPNLYSDFDRDHAGYWGWAADEVDAVLMTNGSYYVGAGGPSDTNPIFSPVLVTNIYYINNPATVPDIAMIHLGHNDVGWKGRGLTNATNNLSVMIDHLRLKNPAVVVLLCKVTPVNASIDPTYALKIDQFAALLPTLAASKNTSSSPVVLVDQYAGYDPVYDTWSTDGVHPTESGEKKMAAKYFEALIPFLTDRDQNGMGDAWETQFFGSTGVATNADPDADGLSNLQEYVAGCDPTSLSSKPEMAFSGSLNGIPTWQIETITQRTYRVDYRTNLVTGSWQLYMTATGNGGPLTVTNSADQGLRFYRYRISLP